MATKTIKAWIDSAVQDIEVEDITSPEQGLSIEDRLVELEDKPVVTDGNFLVGNGTEEMEEITPEEVLSHINGASVATMTTAEYEAMSDEEQNANTLYMLTDSEDDSATLSSDVSGNIITLNNAASASLAGLKVYGKTTQNGTPTPDAPVPLESAGDGGSIGVTVAGKNLMQNTAETKATNGITFTVNDDGSVTANGTATATAFFNINTTLKLSEGTKYILSGCPSYTGVLIVGGNYGSDSGNGMTFTALSTAASALSPAVYLRIASGTTVNNIVFKPMLRLASVADNTYEPYKGQALTLSTPNGLPGIPVTSGGNYTDENGQQWLCDEVDFGRGVYVQRVNEIDLGTQTWNRAETASGFTCFCSPLHFSPPTTSAKRNKNILCSHYPPSTITDTTNLNNKSWCGRQNGTFFIRNDDYNDVSAFTDAMNGVMILYKITTPIETPLTSQELAQYAALRTYSPSTTIYNDAGADMEVKYYKPSAAVSVVQDASNGGKVLMVDNNGTVVPSSINTIPNSTTSDNGKFLRVVDGVAAWQTISNAEEASF